MIKINTMRVVVLFMLIWLSIQSNAQQTLQTNNAKIMMSKISFDFSAKILGKSYFLKGYEKYIEIYGVIKNTNSDTVYFLSSSCDGTQYFLQYDTSKFYLTPMLQCNISRPIIIKIAPYSQFNFDGYFEAKKTETKIKLCFDFYQVDKSWDVSKWTFRDVPKRTEKQKTFICAGEKDISQ